MSDTQELRSENLTVKKTRILTRRNGRMKLQFNLSKDEATAFKNFYEAVNVNNNTEEEFVKAAFILGLRTMEKSILEQMKAEIEKQQQEEGVSESVEFVEEDDTEKTEE